MAVYARRMPEALSSPWPGQPADTTSSILDGSALPELCLRGRAKMLRSARSDGVSGLGPE
jgi:hypothetical protein